MHEIDLIPADYRQECQKRSWIRTWIFATLFIVLVEVALHVVLSNEITELQTIVGKRGVQRSLVAQKQDRLADLRSESQKLERQLAILKTLHSGISTSSLFSAIDKSIDSGKVWFTHWRYQSNTGGVGRNPVRSGGSGPSQNRRQSARQNKTAQPVEARVDISGMATDHAALSLFVSRLVAQPRVEDARIVSTKQLNESQGGVVSFHLLIRVSS